MTKLFIIMDERGVINTKEFSCVGQGKNLILSNFPNGQAVHSITDSHDTDMVIVIVSISKEPPPEINEGARAIFAVK